MMQARIKQIWKDFTELRYRFLKLKIEDIRRNLYEIENKKNLPKSKTEEIEKNRLELEESFSKLKKYYDCDDIGYKETRDVKNLFNLSINEDYYKPIRNISAFDNKNNYIEYASNGDADKILSVKEYLNMIKAHLSDMINDYKTQGKWEVHLGNVIIDYKTKGEWKIQLSMTINFISSKDSDEIRIMHTKSDNIETLMGSETGNY